MLWRMEALLRRSQINHERRATPGGTVFGCGTLTATKDGQETIPEISAATKEAAKGNSNITLTRRSHAEETGDMARNFLLMVQELSGTETFRNDFRNPRGGPSGGGRCLGGSGPTGIHYRHGSTHVSRQPDTVVSGFIARSGMPKATVHSLRHTYASLMIADNAPLIAAARQLGHAQASTTANIYAHAIVSAQAKAMQTFDRFNDLAGQEQTGEQPLRA